MPGCLHAVLYSRGTVDLNEPVHAVRASITGGERRYMLDSDTLSWNDDKGSDRIRYADISRVQLIKYPAAGGEHCQCTLSQRRGKHKIRSHHYKSLGNFEDRSASYANLVRKLCARVADASPDTRFIAGSTAMWYVWVALLVGMGGICVLLLVVMIGGGDLTIGTIAPVIAFFLFLPAILKLIRRGQAKSFDPQHPPSELIGSPPVRQGSPE
jgi:hypothetical protein